VVMLGSALRLAVAEPHPRLYKNQPYYTL